MANLFKLLGTNDVKEALAKSVMESSWLNSALNAMETRISENMLELMADFREGVLRDLVKQEVPTAVRLKGSVAEDAPSLHNEDGRTIDASQQAEPDWYTKAAAQMSARLPPASQEFVKLELCLSHRARHRFLPFRRRDPEL